MRRFLTAHATQFQLFNMAMYMYSDSTYDYYGSSMNKPVTRTLITAKDNNGKVTFKSESKGKLSRPAIDKILKAWCVDQSKERVEIQYA